MHEIMVGSGIYFEDACGWCCGMFFVPIYQFVLSLNPGGTAEAFTGMVWQPLKSSKSSRLMTSVLQSPFWLPFLMDVQFELRV
jgi:hypothetical protein